MSVIITVRVKVADTAKARETLLSMSDVLTEVAGVGKSAGAIHHQFLEGNGEIVVLDEWSDEASFQKFFASTEKIKDVMAAAGAIAEPRIEVLKKIEAADTF